MSLFNPYAYVAAGGELISLLIGHRQLTWEMAKREISHRYAGQVLGALWAIGHPLLLMGLYVFVFAYVFRLRLGLSEEMPRSAAIYILCGLIPWMTFADAMNKGATVILDHRGLVKQVVFPVETLPVKSVLASFLTQLVATAALLTYVLVKEGGVPWTVLLLPALFTLQFLAMVGVCFLLASVGVFFRDLREIVQFFTTAGLFIAPILYLPGMIEKIWPPLKIVLLLNPFSYLVWCYQDLLYYGRFEHPVSWAVTIVLSATVFCLGCRVFRKLKPMFGEML